METQMESQPKAPCVLASLMGLDEIALQQPVKKHKSHRVLSENYLQRVSSIGVWEHRSFSKQHTLRVGIEKRKQQKRTEQGNSKLHQKLQGSLKKNLSREHGLDDFHTFLEPQLGSKIQACPTFVRKEKPGKMENVGLLPNVLQLPEDARKQNCDRTGKYSQVGFAGEDMEMGETRVDVLSVSDCRSLNRNCILDYRTFNQSYPIGISSGDGWRNMSVRKLPTAGLGYSAATESTKTRMGNIWFQKWWCMNKRPTYSINLAKLRSRKQSSSDEASAEVKNSFNWHLRRTTCQSSSFLKSESSHSAQDKSAIQDSTCYFKNRSGENATIFKPSNHDAAYPDSTNSCAVQQAVLIQDGEDVSIKNRTWSIDLSQTTNSSICCTKCDDLPACLEVNEKNIFVHESPKNQNPKLVSSDYNWDAKLADSSWSVSQASNQQEDSAAEVSEESSVASHYSSVDRDSLGNFDVCHSSPVSVLEASFEGGISSFSKWYPDVNPDLCGMNLEAGVLESGASEAGSEWSGVIVSSDDEAEEERIGHPGDNELIKRFKVEESRDFSYMVDILIGAGFLEMGFVKWHSPDSPINPSVFDMLEKKYGDQKCWRGSGRRLFFDRVNFALMKILQPWLGFPTWANPAAGRLSIMQIEEQLWTLLANQEKEARTMISLSEKALGADGDWLPGNDIEVISREVEDSLVEDLVSDMVRAE